MEDSLLAFRVECEKYLTTFFVVPIPCDGCLAAASVLAVMGAHLGEFWKV